MMFAHAKASRPTLIGQHGLRHDVAEDLRLRERPASCVQRDVAEGIQTQCDRHEFDCSSGKAP